MANFTTENNTYCFRIGPAFLDTCANLKVRTWDFSSSYTTVSFGLASPLPSWAQKYIRPSSETQGQIVGARERLNFFRPFSLSLAPTICPWVSEDDIRPDLKLKSWNHVTHNKQYHKKMLLWSFHLKVYTFCFHPQSRQFAQIRGNYICQVEQNQRQFFLGFSGKVWPIFFPRENLSSFYSTYTTTKICYGKRSLSSPKNNLSQKW